MQKHFNLAGLAKSFPMNIYSQQLALIQTRTSRSKFAHDSYLPDHPPSGSEARRSADVPVRPRRPSAPERPFKVREIRVRGPEVVDLGVK